MMSDEVIPQINSYLNSTGRQGLKLTSSRSFNVAAEQAAEKVLFCHL
jgi:hypothetical protein